MNNLWGKIRDIRIRASTGKISLEEIMSNTNILVQAYSNAMEETVDIVNMEDLLMIFLNVYTYSEGSVIITDRQYDVLMEKYLRSGGSRLTYADGIFDSAWKMVKHEAPYMVGSISKVYTIKAIEEHIFKHIELNNNLPLSVVISPKYDGVSVCLKVESAKLIQAVTRGDGIKGQDITKLVLKSKNIKKILKDNNKFKGYIKCEMLIHKKDFDQVSELTGYKNRRSAVTGIINTPSNISYGEYITLMPLVFYNKGIILYGPTDSVVKVVDKNNIQDIIKVVNKLMDNIRDPNYPYRVDGGVIYPIQTGNATNELNDVMEDAIAYKINTAKGITIIEYPYISIGRTGAATPMLKVKPCDVNETTVTDVSLSTFNKFYREQLHEQDKIEIESAGDVIPQMVSGSAERTISNALPLSRILKLECPVCNSSLDNTSKIYYCKNPKCPRILTGKITNFIVKLGADNISDRTIEALYNNDLIEDIPDIFKLKSSDISKLDGFEELSALKIISEIDNIKSRGINISDFYGALGIPSISKKKCRLIFSNIELNDALRMFDTSTRQKVINSINGVKGIGDATLNTLITFIETNSDMIKELVSIIRIVDDEKLLGNVVFTGFRDQEIEDVLFIMNIETSDNINSETIALIAANIQSTKSQKAIARGIPVIGSTDIKEIVSKIKDILT